MNTPRAALPASGWLEPLAGHWIQSARSLLPARSVLARVTIMGVRGSAPREPGASMLIHDEGMVGTIGGGHLEWEATAFARRMLEDPAAPRVGALELNLGPDLGQCCGGRVELLVERLTAGDGEWLGDAARRLQRRRAFAIVTQVDNGTVSHRLQAALPNSVAIELRREAPGRFTLLEIPALRPPLWIFGAGHVGQALVRLLAGLELFDITWIDSRPELVPAGLPDRVHPRLCASPASLVADAPAGARFIVMTHDHSLDYALCRAVLSRRDSFWLGLIGSASKAARFRSRLVRDGIDRQLIARLTSPIGIPGMATKLPAAIAIAIAAQLLTEAHVPSAHRVVRGEGDDAHGAPSAAACTACASCASDGPAS